MAAPKTVSSGKTKKTRVPVVVSGETIDLSTLNLTFGGSTSKYDRELDALKTETAASEKPETVGRFYSDKKAVGALRNRATERKIHLQVLPAKGGFAVRLDPDQSKPFIKRERKVVPTVTGNPPTPASV